MPDKQSSGLDALSALTPIIGKFVKSISKSFEGLPVPKAPSQAAPGGTTALQTAFKALTDAVNQATAALQQLSQQAKPQQQQAQANGPKESLVEKPKQKSKLPSSADVFGGGTKPAVEPEALPTGDLAGGGGEAAGGLGAALGPVAIAAAASAAALSEIVSKSRAFVEALSPATIQIFDQSMRDLQATVGTALIPIFTVLTGAIRQVSGILLPVMEAFTPIVQQASEIIAGRLILSVKTLAGIFEGVMPVIKLLIGLWEFMNDLMKPIFIAMQANFALLGAVFTVLEAVLQPVIEVFKLVDEAMNDFSQVLLVVKIVFKAIVDSIAAFIKSLMPAFSLKDVMTALKDATKKAVEGLVTFVAWLAKAFGQTDFLKKLSAGLTPTGEGATAAAQNVGIKDLGSIMKDMSIASANAGAGGDEGDQSEKELLKDLKGIVDNIADGQGSPPWLGAIEGIAKDIQTLVQFLDPSKKVKEIDAALDASIPGRKWAKEKRKEYLGF